MFSYEEYDSDTSLNSFVTTTDKVEDEINAIDGETHFKALRIVKLISDAKEILSRVSFDEVFEVDKAIMSIKKNQKYICLHNPYSHPRITAALSSSKSVICLKLTVLTAEAVKGLTEIFRTNDTLKMIVASRSEEIEEDQYDKLADVLEKNLSLIFFINSFREENIAPKAPTYSLDRIRWITYRNQQLCETAYKNIKNSGESLAFRHGQVTVLGNEGSGRSSLIQSVFYPEESHGPEPTSLEVNTYRFILHQENKKFSLTPTNITPEQFTSMFTHRLAANLINEHISEHRESRRLEVTTLSVSEAQPLSSQMVSLQQAPKRVATPSTKSITIQPKLSVNSGNTKTKKLPSFALAPIRFFGRLTKNKEEERIIIPSKKTPPRLPNYAEDIRVSHTRNNDGLSVTSSLVPTLGQRTVIAKPRPKASEQLVQFYKAFDCYTTKPMSQSLHSFYWPKMFHCLNNREEALVSVLDFSTSTSYKAAHSVFLTEDMHGIVIVTFDLLNLERKETANQELQRIKFWLASVKNNSPLSEIFLVGTRTDKVKVETLVKINEYLKKSLLSKGHKKMARPSIKKSGKSRKKSPLDYNFVFLKNSEGPDFIYFPLNTQNPLSKSVQKLRREISKKIVKITSNHFMKIPIYWFRILDSLTRNVTLRCENNHDLIQYYQPPDASSANVENNNSERQRQLKCFRCSEPVDNLKVFKRCTFCESNLCNDCEKTQILIDMKNEEKNASIITVARYFKECKKYRMTVEESKQLLKYLTRDRFVIYCSSSKLLSKYIILKPNWLFQNLRKLIVDKTTIAGLEEYEQQIKQMKKLFLEPEYNQLIQKGIATMDLLNQLWGKLAKFLIELLEHHQILAKWNSNEQNFIVFDMVKDVPEEKFISKTVATDVKYLKLTPEFEPKFALAQVQFNISKLDTSIKQNDIFRSLVCAVVEHCRTLNQVSFKEFSTPEPSFVQRHARIYFTHSSPVYLSKVSKHVFNFKIFNNEKDPELVLSIFESTMRQLNTDLFGSYLEWKVLVSENDQQKSLVPLVEARKNGLAPWITLEVENSGNNNSRQGSKVIQTESLYIDAFLEI